MVLAKVNFSEGTSSVIIEPEPIVDDFPTLTGAIKKTPDPINAESSMYVFCVSTPS